MDYFQSKILNIKAFIFDVDGVLSADVSPLDENGEPVRTANVKDGYAIRNAISKGFPIGIITGGRQDRVRLRYQNLGVVHYYDNVREKLVCLKDFSKKTKILPEEILFMGDDLVDLEIMKKVGLSACPVDAVNEIIAVSHYISSRRGGEGCVRDIIERILTAQNKWNNPDNYQQSF